MLRWLISAIVSLFAAFAPASTLHIMSYHDVRIKQADLPDDLGVTVSQLAGHFAWFKRQGFKVVNLDDLMAAQRAERALPEKALLLTFDDGLASVYDSVLPLLQVFNYPAVVAVVGSWLTDSTKFPLRYGRAEVGRNAFLSEDQLRALANSPLIEFASHSFDLHRGIVANDAGQTQPAAVVRVWDSRLRVRESGTEYERRIRSDLQSSVDTIERLTGKKPRAMVWPFGEFSGAGTRIARELGMTIGMTLTEGRNEIPGTIISLKRNLVSTRTDLNRLAVMLSEREHSPVRFVEVSLAPMVSMSAPARETMLDRLLDRVVSLGATHVIIPAWTSEPTPRALFDTVHAPSIDLMNRIAWQFRTRLGAKVFARWPAARSDGSLASGLQHLAGLNDLIDTVALSGVVFDFETTEIATERIRPLAKIVRDSHPDDDIVIAGLGLQASSRQQLNRLLAPELHINATLIAGGNVSALTDPGQQVKNATWIEFDAAEANATLVQSMRILQREGWLNFGWINDQPLVDQPAVKNVATAFSRRAELR